MIEEANHIVDDNFVPPNETRSNHKQESNWSMYPKLDLNDQIILGKKYRLPEYIVHEIPRSKSAPDVRKIEDSPSTKSGQNTRFSFLRGFLNRLQLNNFETG